MAKRGRPSNAELEARAQAAAVDPQSEQEDAPVSAADEPDDTALAEHVPAAAQASRAAVMPADDTASQQRGWPVEWLPSRQGESPPALDIYRHGRVVFAPLPADHLYAGRCIVWVPLREHVDTVLKKNPPGTTLYVEPPDVLSAQEVANIRRIVAMELDARGIK